MLNPLTAATPVTPIEPSPYYPSSRRYRNPLFLRIEDRPRLGGAGRRRCASGSGSAGRALNDARRIDRDAVFALKTEALEALYARFAGDADFDRYCVGEGKALTEFATYCALAERHGKDWRSWPARVQRPDGEGVATFRAATRRSRPLPRLGAVAARRRSSRAPRARSRSSTTCRSASTSPAPTPGAGRTCWPATSPSARRPTSSPPTGRTGG